METVHIPGFWFLIHISNINNVYNHNAVGKIFVVVDITGFNLTLKSKPATLA